MRKGFWVSIAIAVLAGSAYWVGCGGSDDGNTTRFFGNVSSVQPTTSAMFAPGKEKHFALRWPQIAAKAFAAGSCVAPAGGRLLFCVQTSTVAGCEPVDSNCEFTLTTAIEQDRDTATLTFVDDANSNSQPDSGEATSTLPNAQVYCNGDEVQISNVAVNFTTGTSTGSVQKIVDKCTGTVATHTPGPGSTSTPTRTGTPATPTPTGTPATPTPTVTGTPPTPTPTGTAYAVANSLNEPPSSMLAFLFSAGVVGLLLPRRRRK